MLHYFVPMFKSIRIGFRILYKHKKEAAVWKHLLHLMKKGKVSPWINEHEKMVSARIIFGGKAYSVHFLLSKETRVTLCSSSLDSLIYYTLRREGIGCGRVLLVFNESA